MKPRLLAILGAALCARALPAASAETRPDILLIVADDLGYGDLSAQGCRDFKTPHLDAIADGGMRFTAGYVTAPVCGPSRAALLTGHHSCRILPFDGNPPPGSDAGLPLEHRTIADHLKAAGYRTAALGKWHLGKTASHHPMSRGFDEFFGFLSGMHDYFSAIDPKWGPLLRGRARAELKDYLTFALADEACAFISRPAPEPFFLYLAFNAPHVPLQAPDEYLAKVAHIGDARRRACAAMVLALDDAVGRVLAALRETGRDRNALVVFLSDNGAALIRGSAENGGSNAPLRGSKAQLWEGGIRVPFLARWPGRIAPGGVTDAPVSALDVVPTLLAAAGAPPPPGPALDGLNLLPWLEGKGARFKLSPTHEDVAVCCPVTALKFFPYLVAGLWMKEADGSGLVAVAYAPSAVRTQLGGAAVTVETDTLYPFDDEVRMTVRAEAPARFSLRLRAPVWPGAMTVDAPGAEVRAEDGWRVVTKEWRTGDRVTLRFAPEIARKTPATGGGAYWQRGPLVYVLPIAPQRTKTKEYPVAGFADWDVTPAPGAFWDYAVNKSCGRFDFERAAPPGSADPWAASPIALVGTLVNRKSGMPEAVRLVPMGASLLRHTVFEDADHPAAARPRMDLLKGAANLARKAEVDVSSSARGYRGAALIDGVADGFPESPGAEWASQRGGAGTAAKLRWEMPEQVGSVWLFDRPNPADHVAAARIAFSDGSTAEVGPLPNDGATPLRLKFPTKTITWLEIVITRVGPQSRNAGLAEIAVFDKEPLP